MPERTATLSEGALTILLGSVIGMLFLALGLIAFFVVYQRRLSAQEEARRRAEQAHERELLSAAVEVQESERRRIAGDLHDDIGSLLSAARLYLGQFRVGETETANAEIKQETLDILDEMIGNARRITHDLMPVTLEKFGFFAALDDLLGRVRDSGGITVKCDSCGERRLLPKTEVALFRIFQEFITNTLKHAGATTIYFGCDWQQNTLILNYRDDGKGIDTTPDARSGGLGLRNVESRVRLIDGELAIVTGRGRGFAATITLPNAIPVP